MLEQGVNLADERMELAYLSEDHLLHQCQCALSVPIHEVGQTQFDLVDQDSDLIESRYMARKQQYETWLKIKDKPVEKPSRNSFEKEEGKTNVMNTYHGLLFAMSRPVDDHHVIKVGKQEDLTTYSAS